MKYLILNKSRLLLLAVCFCFVVVTLVAAASGIGEIVAVVTGKRKIPIYCVQKDEKVVSISFDAAWGNEDTEELIDILGKYNVIATFFIVGDWVDKYPHSVKALHDAGHSIQNHSANHPHMTKLSREEMMIQIKKCDQKIEAITGIRPTLFRPPYGDYNNALIEVLEETKHYCIQWDVDSLDWKDRTAQQIKDRVVKRVKPGSIVLFHNAAKNTPAALPGIIEELQSQGYKFVPLIDLIYKDNYYIDHTGKQIPIKTESAGESSGAQQSQAAQTDLSPWQY